MKKFLIEAPVILNLGSLSASILKLAMGVALILALAVLAPNGVKAAAIATIGQDDGYSGRMLDKIAAKWKPPKQMVGAHRLKIILSVDSQGELIDCQVQKGSGLDALDVSACAAAKSASPYGPPPYGMPATLHFSFWTGGLDSRVPIQDEKEQANAIHAQLAAENARFANERAQAKAEAAAKSSGKTIKGSSLQTGKADEVKAATTKAGVNAIPQSLSEGEKGKYERYISKITWELRKAMYVPAEAKPGSYHATVQLECDRAGKIISSTILKSSGNSIVDKYVLRGIQRAKKIQPPPAGFGNKFDLTFTMVRN